MKPAQFAKLFLLLCLLPSPALAYLEPGTGSLLLQALAGTVAVVLVSLRLYWDRAKALLRRLLARTRGSAAAASGSAHDHDAAPPSPTHAEAPRRDEPHGHSIAAPPSPAHAEAPRRDEPHSRAAAPPSPAHAEAPRRDEPHSRAAVPPSPAYAEAPRRDEPHGRSAVAPPSRERGQGDAGPDDDERDAGSA